MNERRTGTYVSVKYTDTTTMILSQMMGIWQIKNPVSPNKLHTTVIYSRTPIPLEDQRDIDVHELRALGWSFIPKKFELFPFSGTDSVKKVLVMTLHAPELESLHKKLVDMGATHDFDEYIPHITLSYDAEGFDCDAISPGTLHLHPAKIQFEPLDLNWKE